MWGVRNVGQRSERGDRYSNYKFGGSCQITLKEGQGRGIKGIKVTKEM